ncbi:MAG: ABC transporter ATP-binding protein [Nannocystaceae bacterium]|nr:ABC transporter ATP-binding protein [Nannocystaceae bacterium]
MKTLARFIARYARSAVPSYAIGAVMLVLTNWVVVRIPALIGDALTVLEAKGSAALLSSRDLAAELMLLAMLIIVVRTLSRVLFFNPGRDIEHRVRLDLFGHLLTLQRPYFMHTKVGELVSIASNDTTAVRLLMGFAGLQVLNVAVAIPMHLYQMLVTDAVLTAWCLVPVTIGGLVMRSTIKRFFGMIRQTMALLARLSDRVLESYTGIGTIRSHAAEKAAAARFEERNQEYLRLMLRLARIRSFEMPILGLSGLIGTGIVLWVGGNRVLAGEMPVGAMATFTALLTSMVSILTSLAWVMAAIGRGLVSIGRVDAVLQTESGLPPVEEALAVTAPPRLKISNLDFTYPDGDEPALKDIDVVVEPGHTLGIFGKTGSGKTTLVNVLARVHTPPAGSVYINGHDITRVALHEYRAATAVVPQTAFLFSTSLRENIRLDSANPWHARQGKEPKQLDEETDTRLLEVLGAAALSDDIAALPDGLATVVGERGVMLSGGQRQRTAFARALYLERPFLLIDDVLSAVDQGTESSMVAGIRDLRGEGASTGPTTVIVSHRTSVLEHANEILVLEEGHIIERGTHAELIAAGGQYAQTHEHQVREGDEEEQT